jgi:mannose-1-phosphate guanylyltransferase
MSRVCGQGRLWSIILAGGEGERLRPLVQRWLGRHRPKQYCTFVGTRSMLEHTLDRVDPLCSAEHRVTVITRSHLPEAEPQLVKPRAGVVVVQPVNRNTAPGVFLGLTHVRAKDPKAIVMILPSDHFIHPEDRFVRLVRRAVQAAAELENLVLVGVRPERPETEYGWIVPGKCLGRVEGQEVRAVDGFVEKPGADACQSVMAKGGLWNTLILAARADVLWHMGERYLPEIMGLFEAYGEVIGTPEERAVLEASYDLMPPYNFSLGILGPASAETAVIESTGILWSDWGKPERIVETLRLLGKQPRFSMTQAAALY